MKSKYFFRYQFIIEKLQRSSHISYDDLKTYLYDKFDVKGYDFSYSLRTFQRDKKDIETLFGIEIKYDRSVGSYYINEEDISETSKKLLDAYTLTNALQLYDDFSKYISFEKDHFGNPGIFYQLNDAIKNLQKIKLYYQKFYEVTYEERILKPLALKEFNRRWYLLACRKDENTGKEVIRTYALDRILKVEKLKTKFNYPDFNLQDYFKNFYGIITDKDAPFAEVILSFDAFQGKYVKSLPIHHSQQIIKDTEDELVIKLNLHITFDFVQKLLSFGKYIKIIEPDFLRDIIKNELRTALEMFN